MSRRMTETKLKAWRRRAEALDKSAKRLMDDMATTLSFDDEATDPIDNVIVATEDLVSVLSRPELSMWGIKPKRS